MPDDPEEMRRFVAQGRGVREVLQAVEDALVDAGYDDFVVATDRGTFRWMLAPSQVEGRSGPAG